MNQNTLVTFKNLDMHEGKKSWIEFLAAKLMPLSHTTDSTKDKATLIYAIVIGKTIDVGNII